jgi:hypothetical protein
MGDIVRNDKGKIVLKTFAVEELEQADADMAGFCLACGAWRDGCEPDARRYECEECGLKMVFGTGEIAIMGLMK